MEELTEMYGIFVPNSPDRHVFKELTEVKKFLDSPLGKKQGTRFKKCVDDDDLVRFFDEQLKIDDTPSTSTPTTSKPTSPYKSLPTSWLTEFRRAIEQKNDDRFEDMLKENPRFLININTDSPTILQEGFRFNAMHVACRTTNFYVVKRCLELALDFKWLTEVYGTDRCVEERSEFLLNALLNTPDLVEHNTPLHYACKFGSSGIVALILGYPSCKRYAKNKYNERPLDMLCRGFKGGAKEKELVQDEITFLFRGRFSMSPHRNKNGDTPVQNGGGVVIQSSGDVAVQSSGDVAVQSSGDVAVQNSEDVTVQSSGDVAVQNIGDVAVQSSGDVAVQNGEDVAVQSSDAIPDLHGTVSWPDCKGSSCESSITSYRRKMSGASSTSHDNDGFFMEQQNDNMVDELSQKVSALKRVAGNDVRGKTRPQDKMDSGFVMSTGILESTMKKLEIVPRSGCQNILYYYLVLFAIFAFLIIYYLIR